VLFAGWIGYILVVNGPVASPKYRLPIEPVLVLLSAAGLLLVRGASQSQRAPARQRSDQA
jgi:hypothetical protein